MSVGFIDEPEKEDTVLVTVSFTSGEKIGVRLARSLVVKMLTAYEKRSAKTKKVFKFAYATGVMAFDLTHVSKIDVTTTRGDTLLALIV